MKPRVSPAFARLSIVRCETCDEPAKLACCHACAPDVRHYRCERHRPASDEFSIVLPLKDGRTQHPKAEQLPLLVGGRRPVQ